MAVLMIACKNTNSIFFQRHETTNKFMLIERKGRSPSPSRDWVGVPGQGGVRGLGRGGGGSRAGEARFQIPTVMAHQFLAHAVEFFACCSDKNPNFVSFHQKVLLDQSELTLADLSIVYASPEWTMSFSDAPWKDTFSFVFRLATFPLS